MLLPGCIVVGLSLIFIAESINYFRGQRRRFVESDEEKKMSGC